MKTKRGIRITILGILGIIVLSLGVAVSLSARQTTTASAIEVIQNTESNVVETRIDGWRAIRDMNTYGLNNDNGCGMTAMAILLQYYNDNSLYAGEILPNDLNYALGSNEMISDLTTDKQARANALRGYSLQESPPDGYVTERNDDLFRLTTRFMGVLALGDLKNATIAYDHKIGLERFFQIHCPNLNIGVEEQSSLFGVNLDVAKNQIDNNRPVLLTLMYYNDTYPSHSGIKQKYHVVVAYGYREVNGQTQFLAHSGWGTNTEVWFWPDGNDIFACGFAYIDAPLDRFNTTTVSNGSAVRIDGLKRNVTGNLVIPSQLNGLPVTEIGNNAFSGQTGVTSVTFAQDSSITKIGNSAFSGMSNLASINLPSSLQAIGNSAFANCTALPHIQIPSYVVSIGNNAFANCTNITSISFGGDSLVKIPDFSTNSFYHNVIDIKIITNIRLVAGVTYKLSFDYANFNAFPRTNVRTSLGVGETFETELGGKNLSDDENGRQIIEFTPNPSQLTSSKKLWVRLIERSEFVKIDIRNVKLECDSQLKTIGSSAFSGCTNLANITIPNSVTTIGGLAFTNCFALTNIVIPKSVINIGSGALFSSLMNLSVTWEYNPSSNITVSSFSEYLRKVIIPDEVEYIESNAFKNCRNLRTVIYGSNLKEIKAGAFYGCPYFEGFDVSFDIIISGKTTQGNGSLENIAIAAGKAYLFKVSDLAGTKVLSTNHIDILIADVLRYENGSWFSSSKAYDFDDTDMLFPFNGDGYYVLLKNIASATRTDITFSIFEPKQLNISEPDTTTFNAVNSEYYIFTPEYYGNYGFNSSQANGLSLYTESLTFLKESDINYLECNPLTGGQTYYLKVGKCFGGLSKLTAVKIDYIFDLASEIYREDLTGELFFRIIKIVDNSPQYIQNISDLTSLIIQVKKESQLLKEFSGTPANIEYVISEFAFLDNITIKTILNFSGFEIELETVYTFPADIKDLASLMSKINTTNETILFVSLTNSTANNDKIIIIPSSITAIYIRGVANYTFTNVRFEITSRTTALTLNLCDFSFTAHARTKAIACAGDLNLNIFGTCKIYGGKGLDSYYNNLDQLYGANGITSNNLIIAGTGNLEVFGGNGGNGLGTYEAKMYDNRGFLLNTTKTMGMYGGNGGNGIICQNLNVSINQLKVTGGNGGKGVAVNKIDSSGFGGDGGRGISCAFKIITGTVTIKGGTGGQGGRPYDDRGFQLGSQYWGADGANGKAWY